LEVNPGTSGIFRSPADYRKIVIKDAHPSAKHSNTFLSTQLVSLFSMIPPMQSHVAVFQDQVGNFHEKKQLHSRNSRLVKQIIGADNVTACRPAPGQTK
jgi:hypothetical protein